MMKVYIDCPGDRSVGIPPSRAEVDMEVLPDSREVIREVLRGAFAGIWDHVQISVCFQDELARGSG